MLLLHFIIVYFLLPYQLINQVYNFIISSTVIITAFIIVVTVATVINVNLSNVIVDDVATGSAFIFIKLLL